MHEIDNSRFGEFVASLRKEKQLTQKQLAEKLFISDKAVSKWERGLSLPDISLLAPLTDQLGVTITELIQGERIREADMLSLDVAENIITCSISISEKELKKQRRLKKVFIAVGISCFILACIFAVLFYINCIAAYPDPFPISVTSGYVQDGDVMQWQDYFPYHSSYALGLNEYEKPVFKDPAAALKQIKTDCSDAIIIIQNQFSLWPLTRFTIQGYGNYGWQIVSDDIFVQEQAPMLTHFLDIYENSFMDKNDYVSK